VRAGSYGAAAFGAKTDISGVRRLAILEPVVLLLLVFALVGLGGATWGEATAAPTAASLRLASTRPIVVRGNGFAARERVRVTVATRTVRSKRIRATTRGTFVVTFDGLSYDRCNGLTITATGTAHVATIKRPQPECPIP
jgi:hypothetical protein